MKKKRTGKTKRQSQQKKTIPAFTISEGEERNSPERVLADFASLTHLVVDTSSFILFQELGLLGPLTSRWQCSITKKVLLELERGPNPPTTEEVAGFTIEPTPIISRLYTSNNHHHTAERTKKEDGPHMPLPVMPEHTDRELLLLAESSRQALLSEDRKLLRAGEDRHIPSLDTLLALVVLRYLGAISRSCYAQAQKYLLHRNCYSAPYLGFIEQLLLWIEKEGR